MISSITEASVSSKYHHLSKGVKVMLKLSLISIFMKSFENCVEYSPAKVTFPSPSFSRPLYLMPVWLPSQKFLVKTRKSPNKIHVSAKARLLKLQTLEVSPKGARA